MELRRLFIEPAELAHLTVDDEATEDGRMFVHFGENGEAYTIVTLDDASAIRNAWQGIVDEMIDRLVD